MPEYKKKNKVNELYKEKLDTHFYTTDLYKESKKQTNYQSSLCFIWDILSKRHTTHHLILIPDCKTPISF